VTQYHKHYTYDVLVKRSDLPIVHAKATVAASVAREIESIMRKKKLAVSTV
jgi:hypothetical protein